MSDQSVAEPTVAPKTKSIPGRGQEVWQMQIPGVIHLRTLVPTRTGGIVEGSISIGPNRVGHQFRISTEDREDNQARVVDPVTDPFRNGTLVRVDMDQQADEDTRSIDAVDDATILDLFDQEQALFEQSIKVYGEIPLRRMQSVGERMDVSHRKLEALTDLINERYSVAKSQSSIIGDRVEYLSGGPTP